MYIQLSLRISSRIHHGAAKLIAVTKRTNTRSLYVTRKGSRLTSAQSSITGLYSVRHSPLLLLTLGSIVGYILENGLSRYI